MVDQVICENIGPKEVRKRLLFGGALALVSFGIAVALVVLEAARPLRFLVFPPLFLAALGYYQARERT